MRRIWLPSLCIVLCATFASLAGWQFKRLEWKNGLIERIERNTQIQPLRLVGAPDLLALDPQRDEYRRASIQGLPDCSRATPVWAATPLGSGYWWMVPVRLQDASWIWVNRGYVTPDAVAAWRSGAKLSCPAITIEGLLRQTQTGGGFLRPNDPAGGRWYSRDLVALSANAALKSTSDTWFLDEWPQSPSSPAAQALVMPTGASVDQAVSGLTPLQFPNKHLGYALTWLALAVASVVGAVLALRSKV